MYVYFHDLKELQFEFFFRENAHILLPKFIPLYLKALAAYRKCFIYVDDGKITNTFDYFFFRFSKHMKIKL